jgi:RNA polymerase sigma-70 factor (ECF subfamily)
MPEHRNAQDAEDIRRVLAGDPAAFAGLIARHGRRVHDLARRMLRDAHEAEDVAQQAFLNAFRALERFDLARPFRHWLMRITSNLCRNRIAARKVRAHELAPTGGEEHPPDPADERGPVPRALPGGDDRVRHAIDALPERYRLAVILKYVHELPLEAIAEITEVPVATVKTHLHRGRAALRELLGDPETDASDGGMET